MATYNLGQVAIVSRGAWSNATNYAVLNTVTHNGGSFMAISANSGVEPGVASGWTSSWVAMSRGIKSIDIVGVSSSTAQATITLSDGTVVQGSVFNTNGITDSSVTTPKINDGAVTTPKINDGAVTAPKLGPDIVPANVGFVFGTATPTTTDISEGQVYLKYEE